MCAFKLEDRVVGILNENNNTSLVYVHVLEKTPYVFYFPEYLIALMNCTVFTWV